MPGFTAHLADIMGEVTTDWYGNPLCTTYRPTTVPGRTGYELDAEGNPIILTRGGQCVSNMAGEITVPNLGPEPLRGDGARARAERRHADEACSPPAATRTGSRPRRSRAARTGTPGSRKAPQATTPSSSIPASRHRGRRAGFVCPRDEPNAEPATIGTVDGRVMKARVYYPRRAAFRTTAPTAPATPAPRPMDPISRPWVSLASLQGGDVATAVVRGNPDGTFTIPRVPPGDYMVSVWDEPLNEIIDSYNLTVRAGQTTNIGDAMLVGLVRRDVRHGLQRPQRERPPGSGRARHPRLPGRRSRRATTRSRIRARRSP